MSCYFFLAEEIATHSSIPAWSELLFLPLGNLPDPGIKPESLLSSALAGVFFTTSATWPMRGPRIQSLVGELRPHGGAAKNIVIN